jgi:hypothetical protein
MSDWLEINPSEFSKPEQVQIRGAKVEVFLSPYDMPEAVRGSYNKEQKKFLIEFRYIGGDEPLETEVRDDTTLSIGRRSKRIYKIELGKIELTKDKQVALRLVLPKQVDSVLTNLEGGQGAAQRSGNYRVARKIVEKRAEKLIENQVAA